MNTQTFSRGSDGMAMCLLKLAMGFAGIAGLVMAYGWASDHAAAIQSVRDGVSAWIAGMGVGFWPAGLLATGMVGIAAICTCIFGKMLPTITTVTKTFVWLAIGMVVASLGGVVGWILFEHAFSYDSILTGYQDAMVLLVRVSMGFAAVSAGVALITLVALCSIE